MRSKSPENTGLYLCCCTVFTRALACSSSQDRVNTIFSLANSEKSNLKHYGLGFLFLGVILCLFTCMKKPFCSCRAPIKWSSPVLPPVKEAVSMLHGCPVRREAQPSQEGVLCAEVTSMVSFSGTGFERLLCSAVQVRSGQDEEPWSHSAWVASAPASWGRARNSHNPMCVLLKWLMAVGLC